MARFKRFIASRFSLRFHMGLILAAVVLSGVLVSKLLLELGMRSPVGRYPLAVVLGYGVFFLAVRIWLRYVAGPSSAVSAGSQGQVTPNLGSGGLRLADSARSFGGFGGGRSGGGGASEVWAGAANQPMVIPPPPTADPLMVVPPQPIAGESAALTDADVSSSSSSSSGSSSGSSSFDLGSLDLDKNAIIVLVVFGIFCAVLAALGGYVVYQAPDILSEAAFQAALAAGLLGPSRRIASGSWMGGILKATWVPFVAVLVTALILASAMTGYCPEATRIRDVLHGCSGKVKPVS